MMIFVQVDETLVGGKGGPNKELVLVATEAGGRVRLAHAANNDEATLKRFADGQIAPDAEVTTDGLASYNERSLGERPHDPKVQTKVERREKDALQGCHWTISLLKRWLLGTHAGAVRRKHLQAYLDEFAFRHNRRKTNGTVRIAARVIEGLVASEPLPGRMLVEATTPCRLRHVWVGSSFPVHHAPPPRQLCPQQLSKLMQRENGSGVPEAVISTTNRHHRQTGIRPAALE